MAKTYQRVLSVLEECLAVDPADVTPESHLQDDLGADSLDMLDILFRAEEEFRLRVEREELFPEFLLRRGTEEVTTDGTLTPAGRQKVLEYYPFLKAEEVPADPKALLTVGLLAGFIEHRLALQEAEPVRPWARRAAG
jgi:acyl carrier protein